MGGSLKRGVPLFMGVQKGHSLVAAHAIWGVRDTAHTISPNKQVAEEVLSVKKGANFGVHKVNGGKDI